MKKKLSLILAILTTAALISLTACSGNNSPASEESSQSQNNVQSSQEPGSDTSDDKSDDSSSGADSSDDTSSDDNSSDDTSSEDNSSDDTSSEDNSSDDTSSEDNSSDDTSSDSSNDTSSDSGEPVAPSEKGDGIAKAAYDMLGKPFTEGGYQAETGFDNSGLIYYALTSNGIDCPRGLTAQKDMGKEVTLDALQKGDIVFIKDGDSFFGGVYTGDDTLVFSPYPGQKVRTANLKSVYYIDNFLKAVRVG